MQVILFDERLNTVLTSHHINAYSYVLNSRHLINLLFAVSIQIARRLLGKLLIDLRNTREEAINVIKNNQDLSLSEKIKEDAEANSKLFHKIDEIDQDDDDDKETKYRLDPK